MEFRLSENTVNSPTVEGAISNYESIEDDAEEDGWMTLGNWANEYANKRFVYTGSSHGANLSSWTNGMDLIASAWVDILFDYIEKSLVIAIVDWRNGRYLYWDIAVGKTA